MGGVGKQREGEGETPGQLFTRCDGISGLFRGKALQESLIKVVEACGDGSHNMDRWLSKLENSKWLTNVQTALSIAGLLAECVER